jgi:hypothetical protein
VCVHRALPEKESASVPDLSLAYHHVPVAEADGLRDELGEVYREVFSEPSYEYGDEHVRLFKDRFAVQHQRRVPR